MIGALLSRLLPGLVESILSHREKMADSQNERQRIRNAREAHAQDVAARVVTTGMQYPVFWVAWSIAAVPTCAWFGWGMLDSLCNGALPDVAALPPQLLRYTDTVFGNIFYGGAAMGAVQAIGRATR